MHPLRLRCSSLTYSRYARSSRLAGGAPRPARCYARLLPRTAMHRRDFVRLAGAGLAAGAAAAGTPLEAVQSARPGNKALMKVGTQHGDSDEILRAMAGF